MAPRKLIKFLINFSQLPRPLLKNQRSFVENKKYMTRSRLKKSLDQQHKSNWKEIHKTSANFIHSHEYIFSIVLPYFVNPFFAIIFFPSLPTPTFNF